MGLRAHGDYLGNSWQLISGGIEPGEKAWQTAVREVREETGLAVQRLWRLPRLTQFYSPGLEAICFAPMFVAMAAAGEPVICNDEHQCLEWLDFATARVRMMWPGDRAALDEADELVLRPSTAEEHLRIPLP